MTSEMIVRFLNYVSKIENPNVSTNTPYGAVTFSSPAEISQEEDEEDDDDDQLALLTEGQGPTNLSNNIE